MALKIHGIDVILHNEEQVGVDEFNRPVTEDVQIVVSNVLVYPTNTEDIANTLDLTGKKAVYDLCIPKGDTNDWTNAKVEFFGKIWRTIGIPKEYIEELVPLQWNKQIKVERYE